MIGQPDAVGRHEEFISIFYHSLGIDFKTTGFPLRRPTLMAVSSSLDKWT